MTTTATEIIYTINRRPQTKADQLLYTRKAVSRLMNIDYKDIEFIYVADTFVLVGLYNDSVKLDKSAFKEMFVNDRKAKAQTMTATQHVNNESRFTVRNHGNGHRYQVQATDHSIECECEDYRKQNAAFDIV